MGKQKWSYEDRSEGPSWLERAVIHSASRSKLAFLHDAALAWDCMHDKQPMTRQGKEALAESEEPREM